MSDAISRRIKQLENQNLKFKKLLESTLQITSEQTITDLQIKTEIEFLKNSVAQLEEQKKQLENDLRLYQNQNLDEDGSKPKILQDEHVDIQSRLISSLNDIQRESTEIEKLKTDDEHLKQVITKLEKEKEKLLEEILQVKDANEENNRLAYENAKLKEELARLEQESASKNASKSNFSGPDLVSQLISIENLKEKLQNEIKATTATPLDPLTISTENTVLELKISGLDKQKIKILKELQTSLLRSANEISELHSNTSDFQLRNLLNELDIHKAVLMINLSNIKQMKSFEKPEEHVEDQENHSKNNTENAVNKDGSYCVEYCNLTYAKDKVNSNIQEDYPKMDDTLDMKTNLANAIYQHINMRTFLGSDEEPLINSGPSSTVSCPESKSTSEHLSITSFRSNSSEMIQEVIDIKDNNKTSDHNIESILDDEMSIFDQDSHDLPTVSEEDELLAEHVRLKEVINRLERQKLLLLEQLQNVTASNAQNWGQRNARLGTFMREESSENYRRLPLDDATNQIYATEEQLLEQRVRELEEDNERIRRDLSSLMQETHSDNEDLAILETGERLIRENKDNLGDHK